MTTATQAPKKPKKESRQLKFTHLGRLLEANGGAQIDEQKRTMRVIIITEGLGNLRDKNYYTAEAVQSSANVFRGKQFYIDHPSASDEENRPERSIRDLAGSFAETQVGTAQDPDTGENLAACFATLQFANSDPGRLAFEQAKSSLEYQRKFPDSKDVYAGLSINGGGVSHPGTIRGMDVNMVTEIQEAFSADIVTKPARGGKFLALVQEAQRTAAWKRRHARENRSGREEKMTATVSPKVRKGIKEARRHAKSLKAAVEAKDAKKIHGALNKLSEVAQRLLKRVGLGDPAKLKETMAKVAKLKENGEDGEGDGMDTKGRLARMATAVRRMKQDEAGDDPSTQIADIMSDLQALNDMVGGGGGDGQDDDEMTTEDSASESEDEDEEESSEAEDGDEASESEDGEDEDEASESEDGEDEEEASESEDGEDDEREAMYSDELGGPATGGPTPTGGRAMQYSCASCGETNRVMPPKGFKLAAMGESTKGMTEMDSVVRRLRRTLQSKEARFVAKNRETRELLRENVGLRARVIAMERLDRARKALKEAKIPLDIMKPKALLAYEPEQWPVLINSAKRLLAREAKLLNTGGAGGRDGSAGGGTRTREADSQVDPSKIFQESYKKPKDFPA
jgi:hypothetical protein